MPVQTLPFSHNPFKIKQFSNNLFQLNLTTQVQRVQQLSQPNLKPSPSPSLNLNSSGSGVLLGLRMSMIPCRSNVQACYAQGGRDFTGSVYFISILKDNHTPRSTQTNTPQAQSKPLEMEISYGVAQFSQLVQDLPQPRRSLSLHELENHCQQQQSSPVDDVGFKQTVQPH